MISCPFFNWHIWHCREHGIRQLFISGFYICHKWCFRFHISKLIGYQGKAKKKKKTLTFYSIHNFNNKTLLYTALCYRFSSDPSVIVFSPPPQSICPPPPPKQMALKVIEHNVFRLYFWFPVSVLIGRFNKHSIDQTFFFNYQGRID